MPWIPCLASWSVADLAEGIPAASRKQAHSADDPVLAIPPSGFDSEHHVPTLTLPVVELRVLLYFRCTILVDLNASLRRG